MSPRASEFDAAALLARMTERDFAIIDALARHKIATTATLTALFFPSRRIAAARLQVLSKFELLERFLVPGSGAHRYTLAWRGRVLAALRQGQLAPTRREAELAFHKIAFSAHRAHKEEVNDFFALLHATARQSGDVKVTEWLNEAEATTGLMNVRPDAGGTLTWSDGRELAFWYEHDRGTETLGRLTEMIDRYRTGRIALSRRRILLIGLPGSRRLSNLLAAAPAPTGLSVAAHVTVGLPPVSAFAHAMPAIITEPRWHRFGATAPCSLAELADRDER
ncbi:replication-relaxation family protein [Glycomyces sp. NRRL B-16210]|uniref:replication-relaxation family protein n=1 Tax=Glycomyces sp. NRRL B-16210 TaxID=1463821 RepID=UPI0004C0E004|nr:replication-relaxation family protein [Glycomyces sp. NRRL B-16210]